MRSLDANLKLWKSVEDRIRAAARRGAEIQRERIEELIEIDVAQGHFESPIEAIFAAWWEALKIPEGMEWACLTSQPEVEIGGHKYRPDFIVSMDAHPGSYGSDIFTPYPSIAIELDGHEFHERTKEQVTYRNQRDRALQGAGWRVLHVSGSELYRTPEECVTGLMTLVRRAWGEFWPAYWQAVKEKWMKA